MKRILIYTAIVGAMLAVICGQYSRIKNLKADRDTYKGNTEVLLGDVKKYQTADSLNAAKVGVLELKVGEFERFRADDAKLIKSLQTKNRDLERVTTAQTQTITELSGTVRDSIIIRDNYIVDTLRCIDIIDPWFELHGCTDNNANFNGKFINRDSLLVVGTVQYKRFLGFLWKTKRIKNREIDIVSKNPHTQIMGVEYIEVRK